ncbi:DUF4188 domain-containing protein [Rhodococcus sp. T2V]|uniref:monooxygenase family protein n=1 Tax=Rhodococcus sp. T2V TaxID=3034164 RepID=UPI0034E2D2F6
MPSPIIVQFWRSFEDPTRFARDRNDPNRESWCQFNKRIGNFGDVGIWHEAYRVTTANLETIEPTCRRMGWPLPPPSLRSHADTTWPPSGSDALPPSQATILTPRYRTPFEGLSTPFGKNYGGPYASARWKMPSRAD